MKTSRKFAVTLISSVLVLGAGAVATQTAFAAPHQTWYVDANVVGGTGSGTSAKNAMKSIQTAVNAAASGDTVKVAAGIYDAFQVVGKSDVTIDGAGNTTIIAPSILIDTHTGHKYTADMQVSVFVNGSTGISLKDMQVEGNGTMAPGLGGPDALLFWNASQGTVNNVTVLGTYTINGDQTGQGIAVDAGAGQTSNVTIENSSISGFQKNAVDEEDGNSLSNNHGTIVVDLESDTITGVTTAAIAQNGIVAWNEGGGSVSATIKGTTFSNFNYTGATGDTADAVLAFGSALINPLQNDVFSNTQLYIESAASGVPVDATKGNMFDTISPASATGAQLASIENKLNGAMETLGEDVIYILPKTLIATTQNRGINVGLSLAQNGYAVIATPGTYNGDVTPPASNNVTLEGLGGPVLDLGAGYGVNLDNNVAVTNFTFQGFTVNSSASTLYAFKAYKANGLELANDTFNGNTYGGGVDINTSDNVTIDTVNANGFHKNGFADTAAYLTTDSAGNNITFNNITASNNGWTGISFYTIGDDHSPSSIGGSKSIKGVEFTGTNTISGNGEGVFVEGDSDANRATYATPHNKVTSDGTTLDLSHVAFSGNIVDIENYQTAPVNAVGATFDPGAITGDQMTAPQRTTEDGKIIDQLDHSNLGLVTYYTGAPFEPTVTVTIDKFVNGAVATAASTGGASFEMNSSWDATNIGSDSGSYALGPTGFNSPNAYEAVTSDMTSGASYSTQEQEPAECTASYPFELAGYTTGDSLTAAEGATPTLTPPALTNITQNQYIIVWNKTCPPAPQDTAPADGSTLTSAQWTEADWSSVTDPAGGITYIYESSNSSATNSDGSFVSPVYTSGALSTNSIPTTGTPDGTYYWHARAVDTAGNMGPWGTAFMTIVSDAPAVPTPSVTTNVANPVGALSATLNGTNGPIDADNTSFWWGTTMPTGPITASATPYPGEFPSGWNSTGVNTGTGAGNDFNFAINGLTPNTPYYAIAWVEVGGTWYPGSVVPFTTIDGSVPSVTTNDATDVTDASATINGTNGPIDADNTSFWWGIGDPTSPFTASATPYPSQFPSGWSSTGVNSGTGTGLTFNQMLSGLAPSTTYDFVAWVESGGIWYPGNLDSLITSATPPPAPTANPDIATTNMNTEVAIDVLANDTNATLIDTDAGTLTQPTNGVATIDGSEIDYTPNTNFAGTDSFTYEAVGAGGTSTPATVTVTVKDTTTPVLTLVGNNPAYVKVGGTYSDDGVTISDTPTNLLDVVVSVDGGATTTSVNIDTTNPGVHTILYAATDGGGNTGYASREVDVLAAPTATLTTDSSDPTSDNPIHITATFSEPVTGFNETSVSTADVTGISNFEVSSTNDLVYTFDVTPSGSGTVVVSIAPSKYQDLADDSNTTQAQLSLTYNAPSNNNSNSNSGGGGGGGPVTQIGDINGDGHVNLKDFALLLAAFGSHGSGLAADLNHDGVVNALDLAILLAHWTG